jgi:hypothetical protein
MNAIELNEKIKQNMMMLLPNIYNNLYEYQWEINNKYVDPGEFCDYLNIVQRRTPNLISRYDSYVVLGFDDDRQAFIMYDKSLMTPKLKYVVMFEIAYFLLMEPYKKECQNGTHTIYHSINKDELYKYSDEVDKMCDIFAMKALMPEDVFKEIYEQYGVGEGIYKCAEYFNVEVDLAYRYAKLLNILPSYDNGSSKKVIDFNKKKFDRKK